MADYRNEELEKVERDPRRQWGWGPSEFARPEEKAAYEAYVRMPLIESGQLSTADLPEEYGGRPTGTTRRSIRMQEEWDKRQQEFIQNQQMIQDMEIKRGFYNLRLDQEDRTIRDEKIAFEAAQLAEARNYKIQKDAEFIFDSIKGGIPTSDGSFTSPINPYEEGALTRITSLMDSDGMEDPRAKEAVMLLYKDALRAEEKRMADTQARSVADAEKITELTKLAKLTDRNASDLFAIDPETKSVIVNPAAVGEAEADLALREKAGKEGPSYSDLNKDAGLLRGKIRDINLDIIVENNLYNKAKTDKDRAAAQSRIEQLEAQRDFLSTEYIGLQSVLDEGSASGETVREQVEIPKFNTPEEAEAAGLRAGTIVEIGGRRARID
jgi:hypothetical protein